MFKTIRRYYWVTKSFLARHSTIIVRTTGIVLSLILIFFLFARYIPTPKHTIRLGRVGKYSFETFPADIQAILSRGLVSLTQDGKVNPELAESWEIQDDGKTYVFKLDDRVTWHDGSPLLPRMLLTISKMSRWRWGRNHYLSTQRAICSLSLRRLPSIAQKNKFGTGEYRETKVEISSGVLQSLTSRATQRAYLQILSDRNQQFDRFQARARSMV
jgi:hypothetical protein